MSGGENWTKDERGNIVAPPLTSFEVGNNTGVVLVRFTTEAGDEMQAAMAPPQVERLITGLLTAVRAARGAG